MKMKTVVHQIGWRDHGPVAPEEMLAGCRQDRLEAIEGFMAMVRAVKRGTVTVPNAEPYNTHEDRPLGYRRRALPDNLYRCLNTTCRAIWWFAGDEAPDSGECPACDSRRRRGRRSHSPWPLAWRDPSLRPWTAYIPVPSYRPRKAYTRRQGAAA